MFSLPFPEPFLLLGGGDLISYLYFLDSSIYPPISSSRWRRRKGGGRSAWRSYGRYEWSGARCCGWWNASPEEWQVSLVRSRKDGGRRAEKKKDGGRRMEGEGRTEKDG